eukprot:1157327-Pelagomonas_calceolata.AAC.8
MARLKTARYKERGRGRGGGKEAPCPWATCSQSATAVSAHPLYIMNCAQACPAPGSMQWDGSM